ncbi:MAG TPA: glycosyltransferase family 4 protein [Hyphomicrobiaceae bacterium]|jgi:glycosyltransferase involved in cell wall biosynthesis|nr:glycosyltransferase family 4 protein [Hyphomicrobiaceae bacterium]
MLVRCGIPDFNFLTPPHVMFLYLGRRGSGRFTLELARCIAELAHVRATFCVSRQTELFQEFAGLTCRVLPVDTFEGAGGALARGYRVRTLYRNVLCELTHQRSAGVVTLMPHIWTPLFAPLIRNHGFRYLSVIHDTRAHPGDQSSLLNGWALRDALNADPVITLSRSVADTLCASGAVARDKLVTLFHPDLQFGTTQPAPADSGPFRVLSFGRNLACKGLTMLVEAMEMLRAEGLPAQLGVFGDAPLGPLRARLDALGAEVQNRRIADREVGAIFARHHAVALSPHQCSQSDVAAIALGAGRPLVGCAAGGLAELICDGKTGVLAERPHPASLAAAIRRLATDAKLYDDIRAHVRRSAWERSMRRFAEHLVALATAAQPTASPDRQELTWV